MYYVNDDTVDVDDVVVDDDDDVDDDDIRFIGTQIWLFRPLRRTGKQS